MSSTARIESPWYAGVILATLGWFLFVFGSSLPDGPRTFILLGSWLLLPLSMYQDGTTVRDVCEWPRHLWAYLLASLLMGFMFVPGLVYLWQRRKATADIGPGEGWAPGSDHEIHDADQGADARGTKDSEITVDREREWILFDGDRYHCSFTQSPNRSWTLAFGTSPESGAAEVFALEGDELRWSRSLEVPLGGVIANDGTALVTDALDQEERAGKAAVFDADGERRLSHFFNANISGSALTPDGRFAAVATFNPDATTYLFDVEAGDFIAEQEHQYGNVQHLVFRDLDGGTHLYHAETADDEPRYAIDLNGAVVWDDSTESDDVDARDGHAGPEDLLTTDAEEGESGGDPSRDGADEAVTEEKPPVEQPDSADAQVESSDDDLLEADTDGTIDADMDEAPEPTVDTGVFDDLTGFHRDILVVLADGGADTGLELKSRLEAYYDEPVNHGRLYPNLDRLAKHDLIAKIPVDDRSNRYELTETGRTLLRERLLWERANTPEDVSPERSAESVDNQHADRSDRSAETTEATESTETVEPSGGLIESIEAEFEPED